MDKKKPVKNFRAGLVQAGVWENKVMMDGVERVVFSVSLQRSYKDKDGNWQNGSNLNQNDLPKAVLVLEKAFEFISLKEDGA